VLAVATGFSAYLWYNAKTNETKAIVEKDHAVAAAYSARVTLARVQIESYNIAAATDTLDSLIPKRGEHDGRGFGWYYLGKSLNNEDLAFFGRSAPLTSLSASSREPIIASGTAKEQTTTVPLLKGETRWLFLIMRFF
jgi:hypothetical protein